MHPCSRHKKPLMLMDYSTSNLQSISMWMTKAFFLHHKQCSLCLSHCIVSKLHCRACKYSSGNPNNKNPHSIRSFRCNPSKNWSHIHKLEGLLCCRCMSHSPKHLCRMWSIVCCKWWSHKVKLKYPQNTLHSKDKLEGYLFCYQHIPCSL